MNTDRPSHLHDDELRAALVDPRDLAPDRRAHLHACPECRNRLVRNQKSLAGLARTAARTVPPARRPLHPPATGRIRRHSGPAGRASWSLPHPVLAAGVAALVLVAGSLGAWFGSRSATVTDPWAVEPAMRRIDQLAESALPAAYLQIAGDAEASWEEEFWEFVIPAAEEEPLSAAPVEKGVRSC